MIFRTGDPKEKRDLRLPSNKLHSTGVREPWKNKDMKMWGLVLHWRGGRLREGLGGRDKVSAWQRGRVDCADSPGRGFGMNKGTGVALHAL